MRHARPPATPDGRYIVVRGRLWRATDPHLTLDRREALISTLMTARRAVRRAKREKDADAEREARVAIDAAKVALGERGPPWWGDGAPDLNGYLAKKTPYAKWYEALVSEDSLLL